MIGRIYKIYHLKEPSIYYIGSTLCALNIRLSKHRTHYKRYLKGVSSNYTLFKIFKEYGTNVQIELIKLYDVVDNKHLKVYETLAILRLNDCINKNVCFYLQKLYHKKYYIENKIKLKIPVYCSNCNMTLLKNNLNKHKESIKHKNNILAYENFGLSYQAPLYYNSDTDTFE